MEDETLETTPTNCPVCGEDLLVTHLQCSACGTEVTGRFTLPHLATLREPHASLIDMFLRAHGNVKEMERDLGLSYPTVRARLEEALNAAGYGRSDRKGETEQEWADRFEAELAERIRSRVEQSLGGLTRRRAPSAEELAAARSDILEALENGDITAEEASARLRELKSNRTTRRS